MNLHKKSNCADMLLDLVCYEILSRRFSPEMRDILERHLLDCPSCRRKVSFFHQTLIEEVPVRNFG